MLTAAQILGYSAEDFLTIKQKMECCLGGSGEFYGVRIISGRWCLVEAELVLLDGWR